MAYPLSVQSSQRIRRRMIVLLLFSSRIPAFLHSRVSALTLPASPLAGRCQSRAPVDRVAGGGAPGDRVVGGGAPVDRVVGGGAPVDRVAGGGAPVDRVVGSG